MDELARLSIEEQCGLLRASLHGELDISNSTALQAQLAELTGPQLVLDLSELDFLDSSGIRMLLELWHKRVASGQSLHVLAPPQSPAHRVLTIAEVDRIVPVHPSWASVTDRIQRA